MKTPLRLLAILLAGSTLFGCQKVTQKKVYTANVPTYMSYDELRSSVSNDDSKTLERPGKIFLYNHYILINDFETGVHIYNNSNPSAPVHEAFISVPGNVDIAVKDDILYVDSYVDLVAIDISDPKNAKEIGRSQDALSYTIPSGMNWQYPVSTIDQSLGVVTGYEVKEIEEVCENDDCGYLYYDNVAVTQGTFGGSMMSEEGTVVSFSGNTNNVRSATASNNSNAIAGSMARFMMIDSYLYAISDEATVKVFDIASPSMPLVKTFNPWQDANTWGMIETLFTFKDHLFIGSNSGMLAYDVSSPENPNYLSMYDHMTACDPVVANDDYAFVTLRSGDQCGFNNSDQMDIMDISNIMNPREIAVHSMSNPHGLSLDNESQVLFVCDGWDGLRVFDIKDINNLRELTHQSGNTYDVITHRNIAHVIGNEGLVQYQYDQSGALSTLSTIALN